MVASGSSVDSVEASGAPNRDKPAKKATIATTVQTNAIARTAPQPAGVTGGENPRGKTISADEAALASKMTVEAGMAPMFAVTRSPARI